MQITIEMDETGAGTFSVDGSEPTPFSNAEEVCSVIEQMAGQSDEDDGAQAMQAEQSGMEQGFSGARGSQAGMMGA